MFETICTYPLPSDLFSQSIHPTQPLIAVGLASGHVQALRLPSLNDSGPASTDGSEDGDGGTTKSSSPLKEGKGTVETVWQTRRHKGSCRSLAFGYDGATLISAGSEGLVKVADVETGRVGWKIGVVEESSGSKSSTTSPSLLHPLTPQTLLLALDSSSLQIFDLRAPTSSTPTNPRPQSTFRPHDDYISSLTPLPPTSTSTSHLPKQFLSTGGSTLAITDLRRGVLARSEDQETELLSSIYLTGLPKRGSSQGEKALVGTGNGVVSLWEKGVWDDLDERVVVDSGRGGGESLDVMAEIRGWGGEGRGVVVGLGDGRVRVLEVGRNKVVAEVRHDEVEGVVGLGFESEGRMVSGGGAVVKVWQERWGEGEKREWEGDGEVDGDGDGSGSGEDSEEEEKGRKKRKKRKRNKGKDKSGGKGALPAFKGLD